MSLRKIRSRSHDGIMSKDASTTAIFNNSPITEHTSC
jgi:hypothetical protein